MLIVKWYSNFSPPYFDPHSQSHYLSPHLSLNERIVKMIFELSTSKNETSKHENTNAAFEAVTEKTIYPIYSDATQYTHTHTQRQRGREMANTIFDSC